MDGPDDHAAHESDLLAHIAARSRGLTRQFPRVVVGPGDDCAVVRGEGELLLTVDHVVEDRHFVVALGAELIARKAVARSVSDIAAMGGTPLWASATAAIPAGFGQRCAWRADDLFDAIQRWAEHWRCPLVGGDVSATSGPLVLTVTVGGAPHARRGPVLRSSAAPGDEVYVSGALGGSLASGRHATFEPRIAVGSGLCDELGGRLSAMIDVSDGLGRDAGRIAAASGVRIELDASLVPIHDDVPVGTGRPRWLAALADGEDYELCFSARGPSPGVIAGVPMTRIGRIVEGEGCFIRDPDGNLHDASRLGWDHVV